MYVNYELWGEGFPISQFALDTFVEPSYLQYALYATSNDQLNTLNFNTDTFEERRQSRGHASGFATLHTPSSGYQPSGFDFRGPFISPSESLFASPGNMSPSTVALTL